MKRSRITEGSRSAALLTKDMRVEFGDLDDDVLNIKVSVLAVSSASFAARSKLAFPDGIGRTDDPELNAMRADLLSEAISGWDLFEDDGVTEVPVTADGFATFTPHELVLLWVAIERVGEGDPKASSRYSKPSRSAARKPRTT